MQQPSLATLFGTFLRLGMTAFGGPAMIPYIRKAVVDRHGWLDEDTFRLGMGTCQVVPGATAMQVAAWAGLQARGTLGALAAYLGFAIPAFVLMLALTILYMKGSDVPALQGLFAGLQVVVVALVLNAAIDFARQYCDTIRASLLAVIAGVWFVFKGNPILILVLVCLVSIFVFRDLSSGRPASGNGRFKSGWCVPAALVLIVLAAWGALYAVSPQQADLAALMARIDLFAFGGGYVSLPLMLHEVVEVRGWFTEARFMDAVALGQLTPGPIVMTATFVGYGVAGFLGSVVATVAVFTPSFLILRALAPIASALVASPVAARVLKGSLVSLVGLMVAVSWRFMVSTQWSAAAIAVALTAFVALRLRVDILYVVIGGVFLSWLLM